MLFFVLWAVLIPFRGKPGHTPLVVIAALLTVIWALATTGSLLAPFVLAFVLAYVLDPLVDKLEARRVPRSLAIVILTLPVIGILAALVFLVVPAAAGQLGEVIQQAPVLAQRTADFAEGVLERMLLLDIPLIDEEALIAQLRAVDSAAVVAFLEERQAALGAWVWSGFLGIGRGLGTVLTVGSYVVLTPVLTFYLLRDWDVITQTIGDLLPKARRSGIVSFASDFDRLPVPLPAGPDHRGTGGWRPHRTRPLDRSVPLCGHAGPRRRGVLRGAVPGPSAEPGPCAVHRAGEWSRGRFAPQGVHRVRGGADLGGRGHQPADRG